MNRWRSYFLLRRYRAVIVAFAGLAVLGSGPKDQEKSLPSPSRKEQPRRSNNQVLNAMPVGPEQTALDKPCTMGIDNRASDLCAQWKAADAAKSAAAASWVFGAVGTLVGALTLLAAWSAAKWAKKAAEETRRGADSAQATLDSYVYRERAILRLRSAHFSYAEDRPVPDGFRAQVVNLGPSPGYFDTIEWEYLAGPMWPDKLRYTVSSSKISTPDGEENTPHLDCESIDQGELWLAVKLTYRTLGTRKFSTHKSYKIQYSPDDGYNSAGYIASPNRISDQPQDT